MVMKTSVAVPAAVQAAVAVVQVVAVLAAVQVVAVVFPDRIFVQTAFRTMVKPASIAEVAAYMNVRWARPIIFKMTVMTTTPVHHPMRPGKQ